jgi:hypothetical protein
MTATQELSRVEQADQRIVSSACNAIEVNSSAGGTNFRSMADVIEFAKLMAVSDVAVPKHLRRNPGACLAVCLQAVEWKMSPFAVANKSYVVNDRVCYESQLIHAVIEQRAPLAGRLRCKYFGEGSQRRCLVYATIRGEAEPFEYMSPEFDQITPKNSPLWKTKPDLQLFYNASRDWARMYFPDVINGVYADDELDPSINVASRQPVPMPRAIEANVTSPTQSAPPAPSSPAAPTGDSNADVQPSAQQRETDAGAGGVDESTIGGTDDPNPPQKPDEDSQTTTTQTAEIILPNPCSVEAVTNLLMQRKPSHMDEPTARTVIDGYLKTRLSKPWLKLKRSEHESYARRWFTEGFPPFVAP